MWDLVFLIFCVYTIPVSIKTMDIFGAKTYDLQEVTVRHKYQNAKPREPFTVAGLRDHKEHCGTAHRFYAADIWYR